VLVDSAKQEAATALGLSGFPTFVFLDAEGKVLFRTSGEVEMSVLREMIVDTMGT
jgi:thioredoxin-related protein